MNLELPSLCHRVLGALMNGGYQGLVLTGVIWLGLKCFPRVNAATRHLVWLVTLLVVAALPVGHFFLPVLAPKEVGHTEARRSAQMADSGGAAVQTPADMIPPHSESVRAQMQPWIGSSGRAFDDSFEGDPEPVLEQPVIGLDAPVAAPMENPDAREFARIRSLANGDLATGLAPASPPGESKTSEPAPWEENTSNDGARLRRALESLRSAKSGFDGVSPHPDSWGGETQKNWVFSVPDDVAMGLVGLWIAIAGIRLGRLGWQCGRLHAFKARATPAPTPTLQLFEGLGREMRLTRKALLKMTPECSAPMAVGFRSPAVLLPAGIFDEAAQVHLEQVLRHELAHIARRDDWANLLQQAVRAALFFHPSIQWLSTRLTVEREIACDDHVLSATQAPKSYALFLTEFARRKHCGDSPTLAAAWSNQNQLVERINMILDPNRNVAPRPARVRVGVMTAAAVGAALFVLQAGPRLVLAGEDGASSQSTAANSENAKSVDAGPARASGTSLELAVDQDVTETGPRLKADLEPGADVPAPPAPKPHPVPHPMPPPHAGFAPVPVHPPTIPRLAAAPMIAAPAPAVPAAPPTRARRPAVESMERRLERLEQMVESLLVREKGMKKPLTVSPDIKLEWKGPELEDAFSKEKIAKFKDAAAKLADPSAKARFGEEDIARIKEHAEREADRAVRDAERVVRETERALVKVQSNVNIDERRIQAEVGRSAARDSIGAQRRALEDQRRTLEKQLQALTRQIQNLDQERDNVELNRSELKKATKDAPRVRDDSKGEDSSSDEKVKPRR